MLSRGVGCCRVGCWVLRCAAAAKKYKQKIDKANLFSKSRSNSDITQYLGTAHCGSFLRRSTGIQASRVCVSPCQCWSVTQHQSTDQGSRLHVTFLLDVWGAATPCCITHSERTRAGGVGGGVSRSGSSEVRHSSFTWLAGQVGHCVGHRLFAEWTRHEGKEGSGGKQTVSRRRWISPSPAGSSARRRPAARLSDLAGPASYTSSQRCQLHGWRGDSAESFPADSITHYSHGILGTGQCEHFGTQLRDCPHENPKGARFPG